MSSRRRDEPVRLTRIYTRAGDAGETSLGDGSRVPKLDCRIGAFGAVDELNAALGVVLAETSLPESLRAPLSRIQNDLFDVGADLSVPFGVTDRLRVDQAAVDRLEQLCDEFNAELPMLKSFVLPGGTEAAARLHVARTTCRRAERDAPSCSPTSTGCRTSSSSQRGPRTPTRVVTNRAGNRGADPGRTSSAGGRRSAAAAGRASPACSASPTAFGSGGRVSLGVSSAVSRPRRPLSAKWPSASGLT